ncbi:MAG: histidinol-phosphate transaminase [Dehalococcoidia bacterium]
MTRSQPLAEVLQLVRPEILALIGYEPIEPSDLIAERLGISPDQVLKLDGNENPYGPSLHAVQALAEFDGYHRYPDPQQRRLRAALGEYVGVGPEHVVAGAGSDELIDLLVRAAVSPGDGVIDCPPAFGMYGFLTRVAGGRIVEAPRLHDFSLDIDAVRKAQDGSKIVFVASPNNPTGNPLLRAEIDSLLATGLLVVVDEAYVEFGGQSYASLVGERENLVVLRTFSKWAGLAGLRAGYGIMPAALADVLMQIKQPYTPNIAAEVAMLASLDDRERLMMNVRSMLEQRDRMSRALASLEFVEVYPSQANFLLCKLDGMGARQTRDRLAERGIFVRFFETPRLRDCLRISVGLPEDTDRVVEALREIGGKRAA